MTTYQQSTVDGSGAGGPAQDTYAIVPGAVASARAHGPQDGGSNGPHARRTHDMRIIHPLVTGAPPVLDVVVPVHNEAATLERSIRRLHHHLSTAFPYPFQVTIADNASTDATLTVACGLAATLGQVRVIHLPEKG